MARKLKPQFVLKVEDDRVGNFIDIMLDRNTLDFFAEYDGDSFRDPTVEAVKIWASERLKNNNGIEWVPVLKIQVNNQDTYYGNKPEDGIRSEISYSVSRFYLGYTVSGRLVASDFTLKWWGGFPERVVEEIDGKTITRMVEKPRPSDDQIRSTTLHEYSVGTTPAGKKIFFPAESGKIALPFKTQVAGFGGQNNQDDSKHFVLFLPYTEELWEELSGFVDIMNRLGFRINKLLGSDDENAKDILAWVVASISNVIPAGELNHGQ
jgi:hypothetical protein